MTTEARGPAPTDREYILNRVREELDGSFGSPLIRLLRINGMTSSYLLTDPDVRLDDEGVFRLAALEDAIALVKEKLAND